MSETMKPWEEPAIIAALCTALIKKANGTNPHIAIFGSKPERKRGVK